jgi:uncharacterized protein (TIGR03435 family)
MNLTTRQALAGVAFPFLLCIPLFAQSGATPAAAPAFEIADVHPSPSRPHPGVRGGMKGGDRYFLRDATMIDLIAGTYDVDPADVFGGPPWLAFDRFDIVAKAPAGTSDDAAKLMVRALLADRFSLVAHPGTRSLPAFVLSAGKTPKLKPAAAPAEPGDCQYRPPPKNASPADAMNIRFSCHNLTMQSFAEFLHNVASPYLNRPVVDRTGLKGGWDFDLEWTYRIRPDADGVTIFAAVDKQLGLKLESKPAPLPVVVVESANEKPTPNDPNLDKLLPPPPPAEFDVAVIRPSGPDERNFRINIDANNVNIQYGTLQTLMLHAFSIKNGGSRIGGKPPWLDKQHWDIVGKASVDAAPNAIPGQTADLDMNDVNEMLRSLLADRFKLVTHLETRPADVYALVAAGPKMKKADPTNHPSCKDGVGLDGKDPRRDNPLLNRLVSCQNMTMSQLAIELQTIAPGYVPAPVIDTTGLDGAYDFTLSFSKKGDDAKTMSRPQAAGDATSTDASTPSASDPTLGGMSLYDAMQKQLGIKLEKRKEVPMPMLVIDHIEEQPTEN